MSKVHHPSQGAVRVHEQPFHFRAILLDVAQGLLFRMQIQRIQRVNVVHGCIGGLLVSPVAEMDLNLREHA